MLVTGGEDLLLYNVKTSNSPLPNYSDLHFTSIPGECY